MRKLRSELLWFIALGWIVFFVRSLDPELLALPTRLKDNLGLIGVVANPVGGLDLPLSPRPLELEVTGIIDAEPPLGLSISLVDMLLVRFTPQLALFRARGEITVGVSTTLLALCTAQLRACLHTRWASKSGQKAFLFPPAGKPMQG